MSDKMSEPKTRKAKSVVVWEGLVQVDNEKNVKWKENWRGATVAEAIKQVQTFPDGTEYRIFTEHKAGMVKHENRMKVTI